jgi:hypothetical protein
MWLFYGWPISGNVTWVPLQNICKQKRLASWHFFIKLNFKTKTMQFPLPNWVVNIHVGQDAQRNVNKHRICKLSITDCVFLEIFVGFFYVSCRPLKSVNIWNRSPFWNALSREFRCWWNLSFIIEFIRGMTPWELLVVWCFELIIFLFY